MKTFRDFLSENLIDVKWHRCECGNGFVIDNPTASVVLVHRNYIEEARNAYGKAGFFVDVLSYDSSSPDMVYCEITPLVAGQYYSEMRNDLEPFGRRD